MESATETKNLMSDSITDLETGSVTTLETDSETHTATEFQTDLVIDSIPDVMTDSMTKSPRSEMRDSIAESRVGKRGNKRIAARQQNSRSSLGSSQRVYILVVNQDNKWLWTDRPTVGKLLKLSLIGDVI